MTMLNIISKCAMALLCVLMLNQSVFAYVQPPDFMTEFYSSLKYPWDYGHNYSNHKKYKAWYNNYWHQRNYTFNRSVENCQQLMTDQEQINCYFQLRTDERFRTMQYEADFHQTVERGNQEHRDYEERQYRERLLNELAEQRERDKDKK